MPITLEQEDYKDITAIVRLKLHELMPEIEHGPIIFGPEFLSLPLRISTPSTQFTFNKSQEEYITKLRAGINNSEQTTAEKAIKNQQLDSIILFGQLLFSQAASLHFLSELDPANKTQQELYKLVNQEGVQFSCSRFETLSRRKQFKELAAEMKLAIQNAPLDKSQKQEQLANLHKAQGFYYQVNDLNFQYATKPSRDFSNFVRSYEHYGSKLALAAAIIAIGATALSLIPALTPIMAPIAMVASTIALCIGLPLAFKNLGTMLYNLIRFGAEPTPAELISSALMATTVILLGSTSIIQNAIGKGLLSESAGTINKGVSTANSLTKITVGIRGQITGSYQQETVGLFKAKLAGMKPEEPEAGPSP